jgi:hypothetical protein
MRLLRSRWRRADGRPPAPFVVGVGRSGTTLLRLMLDAHPELTIPPETHFIPDLIDVAEERGATPELLLEVIVSERHWGDFGLDRDELLERLRAADQLTAADAIRSFFSLYAEREGKPRWGDKTPIYVTSMRKIDRTLPEARFIHLIRDGRDVALSRAKRSLRDPAPPAKVASNWKKRILRARRQGRKLGHYAELRYEDLVLDTEPNLRRICEFCELPWDAGMLDYHRRAEGRLEEMARDLPAEGERLTRPGTERMQAHALTREPPNPEAVSRWRTRMSDEDRAAFEAVAGDLLADLGYEVSSSPGR